MLESIAGEVEKRPWLLFLAVVIVALLAYSQRNQSQTETTFAGGGAARAIDPNAAAIEEAAINAGQENVRTLASLLGLENTNSASLTGSLAQTEAARATSLASTEAGRQSSLAATEAGRSTSLAQTAAGLQTELAKTAAQERTGLAAILANQEISDSQTSAGVTISEGNNAAAIRAAELSASAASQIAQINAATEAARTKAQTDQVNNQNQTAKDIARAQDNTNIVDNVIHGIETVLSFLPFF